MTLIPCPGCHRHVYTTETACPFCQRGLSPIEVTPGRRAPTARMSRAALVVLGMSSVACGGDTEQSSDDASANTGPATGNSSATTHADGMDSVTSSTTSTMAAIAVYGSPPMGLVIGAGGSAVGGTGGTGGAAAGGEAGSNDGVGGVGGTTPLPGTGGGGQPIYGAPPTW